MAIETIEIPFVAYPKADIRVKDTREDFDTHTAHMLKIQEAQLQNLDDLLNAGYIPIGQPATYEIQCMLWQHWTLHKPDSASRYEYDAVVYDKPIPPSDSYLTDGWELLSVKEVDNKVTYIFRREKQATV